MITADDFVAILIYVIIKSESKDLLSYLQLIQHFTLMNKQLHFEYMRASLLGSIEYIRESIDKWISNDITSMDYKQYKRVST